MRLRIGKPVIQMSVWVESESFTLDSSLPPLWGKNDERFACARTTPRQTRLLQWRRHGVVGHQLELTAELGLV